METLIFSLKFFLKIIAIAIGTYMWSEEPSEFTDPIEKTTIETESKNIAQLFTEQDSLQIDSVSITETIHVENKMEITN